MTAGKDLPRAAAAAATLSGSGPLGLDDLVRPAALVRRLRNPRDPVGAYLRAQFSTVGRALVDGYDGSDPPAPALQQAVVDELNRLLAGDGDLWGKAFAAVRMREEVRTRLQKSAATADRAWMNRFRLEVALPELQQRPLNYLEHAANIELFTARNRRLYADVVERSMGRLEALGAIDHDTRDRLWDPILLGTHYTAILEVQRTTIQRHVRNTALAVAGLALLAMPLLTWALGGRPPVSVSDTGQVVGYLMITLVAMLVMLAPGLPANWLDRHWLLRIPTRYYEIALVWWPGLVMVYSTLEVRDLLRLGTLDGVMHAAGIIAAGTLWLVFLGWVGARAAVRWALDRRFENDHPDVVVVHGMLMCLTIVDADRDSLALIEARQRLANEIERMAACIERVFPRSFEGRPGADPWVTQTARELALGLRMLKRWVATPRLDTAEHLIARLRTDLVHAAAGAWGHFERCAEDVTAPPAATPSVRQRAQGTLRTLVLAGLPLAGVWGAGAWGLGEPLRSQLLVSAGAWAVLTILLYLDPNSSRQLAALRDALPLGKGKE